MKEGKIGFDPRKTRGEHYASGGTPEEYRIKGGTSDYPESRIEMQRKFVPTEQIPAKGVLNPEEHLLAKEEGLLGEEEEKQTLGEFMGELLGKERFEEDLEYFEKVRQEEEINKIAKEKAGEIEVASPEIDRKYLHEEVAADSDVEKFRASRSGLKAARMKGYKSPGITGRPEKMPRGKKQKGAPTIRRKMAA